MVRHLTDAFGAKDPERFFSFQHPWSEDQVSITCRVIGVQMGTEGHSQTVRTQRVNPLLICLCCLAHHAWSKIHKIRTVSHHDGRGRTAGIRTRIRSARAKKYKFCFHHDNALQS